MRPFALALLAFLPPTARLAGQADLLRPQEFRVEVDGATAEDLYFVEMPPGWHITTRAGAILWNPATTARGNFRVEMETYLFDPRGRHDAFGFFLGGRDLEGDTPAGVHFLVREGGEFTIESHLGAETATLSGWSNHPSIASWARRGDASTARNVLAVVVGSERVRFLVNAEEVAAVPRSQLALEGVVGMRIDNHLNLHVSRLEVKPAG